MKPLIFTAALAVAMAAPTFAQAQGAHGAAAPVDLPPICLENVGHMEATPMGHGGPGDEAHQALMAGMDQMNREMAAGGTASDLDVAFVCSMIPHHRGAIDMAKAELQYGDDPWVRTLAEQVIAAQEKEIADMLVWLEEQAN